MLKIRTKKNDHNRNCKERLEKKERETKLSGMCVCMHFVIFKYKD